MGSRVEGMGVGFWDSRFCAANDLPGHSPPLEIDEGCEEATQDKSHLTKVVCHQVCNVDYEQEALNPPGWVQQTTSPHLLGHSRVERRCGVWGLGFGVWGLGLAVWGLGYWGLGCGVWGLGCVVWVGGLRFDFGI